MAWTIGEVIQLGWESLKRQPIVVVGLIIIYFIPNIPSTLVNILEQVGLLDEGGALGILLGVLGSLFSLVVGQFLQVGLVRMFLAAVRGQEPALGLLFSGADRFLPLLGLSILTGLAVMFGLLLLIVPGVILALGLSMAPYYLVDQRQGVIASMRSSWEATAGKRVDLFLLALASFGLFVAGACACLVGMLVTTPIVLSAWAIVYLRLSGQPDGMGLAQPGASAGPYPPAGTPGGQPPPGGGGYPPQGGGYPPPGGGGYPPQGGGYPPPGGGGYPPQGMG